jgi:hypothetical protein
LAVHVERNAALSDDRGDTAHFVRRPHLNGGSRRMGSGQGLGGLKSAVKCAYVGGSYRSWWWWWWGGGGGGERGGERET